MSESSQLVMVDKKKIMRMANQKTPKFIYPEQIRMIITTAQKERYKLLFNILWQTGARISEVLAMTFDDIDFKQHQIKFATKKRKDSDRYVPINHELEQQIMTYVSRMGIWRNTDDKRLFKMSKAAAHMELKHILRKLGYPTWIHLHTFRHSFAVNCLRQGVLINTLKTVMGHANIENTMIYLTVFQPEVHKQMANVQF